VIRVAVKLEAGHQLKHVIDKSNTACSVWADTAYRSKNNEGWLAARMVTSKKPKGSKRWLDRTLLGWFRPAS